MLEPRVSIPEGSSTRPCDDCGCLQFTPCDPATLRSDVEPQQGGAGWWAGLQRSRQPWQAAAEPTVQPACPLGTQATRLQKPPAPTLKCLNPQSRNECAHVQFASSSAPRDADQLFSGSWPGLLASLGLAWAPAFPFGAPIQS